MLGSHIANSIMHFCCVFLLINREIKAPFIDLRNLSESVAIVVHQLVAIGALHVERNARKTEKKSDWSYNLTSQKKSAIVDLVDSSMTSHHLT